MMDGPRGAGGRRLPAQELSAGTTGKNGISLGGRRPDPYRILVSEVMLQQTQVKTVLAYYEPFLERFPDSERSRRLAKTRCSPLGKGWATTAGPEISTPGAKRSSPIRGRVPRSFAELRRLKGIGDYTAAAVASIAFGEAKGVVDGNVLRVMARFRRHRAADRRRQSEAHDPRGRRRADPP